MSKTINIVDLFSGPGGLGEGFSAFSPSSNENAPGYRIRMSVEMEPNAHSTLSLRALYRLLKDTSDKAIYHSYVKGEIPREELHRRVPDYWQEANRETLEGPKELGKDNKRIHSELELLKAKHRSQQWVVIGGPPCQAYSLAGRSRNMGKKDYLPEKDGRHFLYQEYLEVLSIIEPDVFVMENVKGILTSKVNNALLFPKILEDLSRPARATGRSLKAGKEYRIYPFTIEAEHTSEPSFSNRDFVIRSELFGIPQSRHRVILLGVSKDISSAPEILHEHKPVNIEHVLTGLPPLRSRITGQADSPESWEEAIRNEARKMVKEAKKKNLHCLVDLIEKASYHLKSHEPSSTMRVPAKISSKCSDSLKMWLENDSPPALLNHDSRGHMGPDLGRYLFSACWSKSYGAAPKAHEFLDCLAPDHANWRSGKFADRFRTQLKGRPATTITSHISKDGHAFIHYDPTQCRSLSVREAARIQTFPDNYFFEGRRTAQYHQVGNAVPPYLARQLAEIVWKLLG